MHVLCSYEHVNLRNSCSNLLECLIWLLANSRTLRTTLHLAWDACIIYTLSPGPELHFIIQNDPKNHNLDTFGWSQGGHNTQVSLHLCIYVQIYYTAKYFQNT